MDSLNERILLLRGVGFFASAPLETLPRIAAALEPVALSVGAALFEKGDVGDALYVIASGRLRVHDGDLFFNELGPGEVVGEMAALDAELRSASVTAITDSSLLRLSQDHLYDLLMSHAGVARGVIQILCRHLRNRVTDLAANYAYLRDVAQISAAARAIEEDSYSPELVAEVVRRGDALGQLARIFQHMADEVIARERRLRREVQELRIEIDEARQRRQVAEITTSDYFRQLQERADALRAGFTAEYESLDEE